MSCWVSARVEVGVARWGLLASEAAALPAHVGVHPQRADLVPERSSRAGVVSCYVHPFKIFVVMLRGGSGWKRTRHQLLGYPPVVGEPWTRCMRDCSDAGPRTRTSPPPWAPRTTWRHRGRRYGVGRWGRR